MLRGKAVGRAPLDRGEGVEARAGGRGERSERGGGALPWLGPHRTTVRLPHAPAVRHVRAGGIRRALRRPGPQDGMLIARARAPFTHPPDTSPKPPRFVFARARFSEMSRSVRE